MGLGFWIFGDGEGCLKGFYALLFVGLVIRTAFEPCCSRDLGFSKAFKPHGCWSLDLPQCSSDVRVWKVGRFNPYGASAGTSTRIIILKGLLRKCIMKVSEMG